MRENADVTVFYKEWPHIDILEAVERTFELAAAVAEGRYQPHTAVFDCRMISYFNTLTEPVKTVIDDIREMGGEG